jgi:type I restriction enzyme S subunit
MFNLGCFNAPRTFAFENIKRYTGEYKPRHMVNAGDLIIANTDMTQVREILGRPLIIPEGFNPAFISHHVFKASLLIDNCRNLLFFSFGMNSFRERAVGYATGTTVLALPRDALEKHQLVLPSGDVLKEFDSLVNPIMNRIQLNNFKAHSLTALRDTLLPRLISGQLRLPEAEQAIAAITD